MPTPVMEPPREASAVGAVEDRLLGYLGELAAATSLERVWNRHCEIMASYGFDRMIYGHNRFVTGVGAHAVTIDDALILSNHSAEYFHHFVVEKMFVNAPMTHWALANYGACSWGAMWQDLDTLTEAERKVVAYNQKMGVTAGYSISFADPSPRAFGMVALAARAGLSQAEVDAIWAECGAEIEAMNHMTHLKILSLPYHTMRARLTERQREVLEWVGEGKSNLDIATIMGVSVPTVEKHLRLVREKLGVETTAQAILKVSFQNQIYLPPPDQVPEPPIKT